MSVIFATHSSGSLESLLRCPVQLCSTQSSKLMVKVPQSTLTDAVCPLPDQSELSVKLEFCYPITTHLYGSQRNFADASQSWKRPY